MSKVTVLLAFFLRLSVAVHGQAQQTYREWIQKALTLYETKQYRSSAEAFTKAFNAIGGKAYPNDRYNAACAWALAGISDSAFSNLDKLVRRTNYKNINQLMSDHDFDNLHSDKRWSELCEAVKQNKQKAEEHLDKALVARLDTILQDDQQYRRQLDSIGSKYGQQSKEMNTLWQTISFFDSVNTLKVSAILDKCGWLGPDVVGDEGSETLWAVIQHATIDVQDKYLPMMRDAVKNKKAQPSELALLEDRVALRHGRKQVYGSQIHGDPNGHPWISPLEDPDNVDKRRAEVGLEPLAEYVKQWGITWDPAEYKKQLPDLEKREGWVHH